MARTTVSRGSSTSQNTYRGYKAQPTKSSYSGSSYTHSSRTPTGGGYDAAVAARAAEEAARQKRIQEQQAIIAEVEKLKSEVSEAYTDLLNAQKIIGNNITGEYARNINNEINRALDDIEQTVNDLNTIGSKAAEKIRGDGGVCTYDTLYLKSIPNTGTNVTFSCDTDALREQVLPYLKNAEKKLTNASSSSSKLLNMAGSGDAKNVSPEIEDGKRTVNDTYKKVEEFIDYVEQKERENQKIIDKLLDNPVVDAGKNILADVVNTGAGVVKGIGNVGESLFDALVILGAASANSGTYVGGEFVPYEAGKQGLTEKAWKNVMGFVANDYVESAYKGFYENTSAGKWLDENANEPFKSGGTATQIASGIGEVVGIAGLTLLTGGGTAVSAAIAGTAGMGKYTEEYWGNARDNAKEGEEWATEETRNKGIVYGAASGAWDAAQWYVGGKLNDLTIKGASGAVTSAVRVGIDTGLNALDTPFRAVIDAVTSDKTVKEAFEDRGGWKSAGTDVAIGLVGSVGGELFDAYNIKENKEAFTSQNVQEAKNKMKEFFFSTEKIDFQQLGITEKRVDEAFKKIKLCKTDEEFEIVAHKLTDWTESEIKRTRAFRHESKKNYDGLIILRPSNTVEEIIHEVNHDLGDVFTLQIIGIDSRGINEAFTESLALKIAGITGNGKTAYRSNVSALNKIFDLLEKTGYSSLGTKEEIYYGIGNEYNFVQELNKLVSDYKGDFCKEIAENMDIADGGRKYTR